MITRLTTAYMCTEFRTANYDIYFAANTAAVQPPSQYGLVACIDVLPCLHVPARELRTLVSLLRPGGVLALQQPLCENDSEFEQWEYKDSPVRVAFVRRRTLEFVSRQLRCDISFGPILQMKPERP